MSDGIRMLLMIGPGKPVPVPRLVLDALTSVKVTTSTGGDDDGFELVFTLSNRSPLHTLFLISSGAPLAIMRVIIAVTVRGMLTVLADGVMTNHSVTPAEGGQSTVTVKGVDLTAIMDYKDLSGTPFPNLTRNARVAVILAKYASKGIVPKIVPPLLFEVQLPTDKTPTQEGTDLAYITKLAQDVGYVFYLDPGPLPGMSFGYWGPEIKTGMPQPALNTNMDAHTNVESLTFAVDFDGKILRTVKVQIPFTKKSIDIPIPPVSPLNPPLGLILPLFKTTKPTEGAAKLTVPSSSMKALAESSRSSDCVTGTGSLNVIRYGRVLRARKLVGVRGAGPAFDGLHFVDKVTHHIKRGEYTQDFTLKRNALLPNVPVVRP
jgi:hypothetical protein